MISAETIAQEILESMRSPEAGNMSYQEIRVRVIQKHLDEMRLEYDELLKEQGRVAVIAARMSYNAALEDVLAILQTYPHDYVGEVEKIRGLRKEPI